MQSALTKTLTLVGILALPCILAQKPQFIESRGAYRAHNPQGQKLLLDHEKSCYYFPDGTAYFLSTKK